MGVKMRVAGVAVDERVASYSIVEDASPMAVDGGTGAGTGSGTFVIGDGRSMRYVKDKPFAFEDEGRGSTEGRVVTTARSEISASLTTANELGKMVMRITSEPFNGTLQGALAYYFGLCGMPTSFYIDPTLASRPVLVPGFSGSAWEYIGKRFAAAQGIEIAWVSKRVVVRERRQRIAETYRHSSTPVITQDVAETAERVEMVWYSQRWISGAIVYPTPDGWVEDAPIISVDAGTITEHEFQVETSLLSIEQPVPVDLVLRPNVGSVYAVVGNDNLPITAAQWTGMGGSLSVRIGDDSQTVIVTVVAPSDEKYAPYRIAASDGSGDYSTLRLLGTGIAQTPNEISIETGLTRAQAQQELGARIDDPLITSQAMAYSQLLQILPRFVGGTQSLALTSGGVHKVGDTGSYRAVTVGEVNANPLFAGKTVGQMNASAEWGGKTVGEVNAWLEASVADEFANQAFGNIAGARIFHEDCWYRIVTATTTLGSVSLSAQWDTTVGDFNAAFSGMTVGQMNALQVGATIGMVNETPLRKDWA